MKKFFIAAWMIFFAAQVCCAAPSTIDRSTADSTARQSFELRSVEGNYFDVYIVGENENILDDWLWANGDTIYAGDYSAYLGTENSATLARQNVELFADNYGDKHPQRINVTRDNRDGCYVVRGVNGLPDLLVCKIQITGGGYFAVKIFVVKDGRLQAVKFQNDKGTLQDDRDTTPKSITYLDDGTISLPWHTNVAEVAGSYVTIYMFDADNLILIPAYTNKL